MTETSSEAFSFPFAVSKFFMSTGFKFTFDSQDVYDFIGEPALEVMADKARKEVIASGQSEKSNKKPLTFIQETLLIISRVCNEDAFLKIVRKGRKRRKMYVLNDDPFVRFDEDELNGVFTI